MNTCNTNVEHFVCSGINLLGNFEKRVSGRSNRTGSGTLGFVCKRHD